MLNHSTDFPPRFWSSSWLKSQIANFILFHENSSFSQISKIVSLPIFYVWILWWISSKIYSSTVSLHLSPVCEIKLSVNLPQTAQFRSPVYHFIFHVMEILFLFQNFDKIIFCRTSLFECSIFHVKLFSRISTTLVQWFTFKIAVYFVCLVFLFFVCLFALCLKLFFSTFSCLNVIYLTIKSLKQNIPICEMLHN